MRVAYLTSVYPAISHTFIYREINELRKNGICVGTYSIRPCKKQDLVGEEILSEYEKTHVVLNNPLKVALGFLFSFCRHPPSFISLILLSQRFTLPLKFKQRLLNLAYLAEGIYLAKELKKK